MLSPLKNALDTLVNRPRIKAEVDRISGSGVTIATILAQIVMALLPYLPSIFSGDFSAIVSKVEDAIVAALQHVFPPAA